MLEADEEEVGGWIEEADEVLPIGRVEELEAFKACEPLGVFNLDALA